MKAAVKSTIVVACLALLIVLLNPPWVDGYFKTSLGFHFISGSAFAGYTLVNPQIDYLKLIIIVLAICVASVAAYFIAASSIVHRVFAWLRSAPSWLGRTVKTLPKPRKLTKRSRALIGVVAASALVTGYAFYGVRVEATMEISGNRCPSDQPIMVTFHNYTFRTVDGGYLILEALKDDSGPNLFAEPEKSFFSHMGPLESDTTCLNDSNFNFHFDDGETDNYRFNISDATREILAWQSKTKGVGIRVQYLKVDH